MAIWPVDDMLCKNSSQPAVPTCAQSICFSRWGRDEFVIPAADTDQAGG